MKLRKPCIGLFLLMVVFLAGCRDTPAEVIVNASEAAKKGDLVALEESFSIATIRRLERSWDLSLTSKSQGWTALSKKLLFGNEVLNEGDEFIVDEFAKVMVVTGAVKRDYYLRKEDGKWRIELGSGTQYRKVEAIAKAAAEAEEKED
jgi:hypothetical protein